MTSLKFYNDLLSQPVRAIWIFLKANKIPFEDIQISLLKGEHKTKDYLKKFPTGTVPAIEDDGFTMIESVAILLYLCDKYANKVAPHWYPKDIRHRAKVDEVISWQHTNIRKNGSGYFLARYLIPLLRNTPFDYNKIQENASELEKTLDFMDRHLLKATNYIAGDDITLADLLCICEIMQPVAAGYDVTKGRPKLATWMERVKSRLGTIFVDAHQKILERTKVKPYVEKIIGF